MCARSVLVRRCVLGVAGISLTAGVTTGLTAVAAGSAVAAGPASSLEVVGRSPGADVVAGAPQAVSVTLDHAPDRRGASMRVFGPSGEVSAAQAQVIGNAVRRVLDPSIPGGDYLVTWSAREKGGGEVSGSFTFTATTGSGQYAGQPAATPDVVAPPNSSAPQPVSVPVSVPQAPADEPVTGALSAPLLVVPVGLGLLLVLASAGIGALSRPRTGRSGSPAQVSAGEASLVDGRLPLTRERHQAQV